MKELICSFGGAHFRVVSDDWFVGRLEREMAAPSGAHAESAFFVARPGHAPDEVRSKFEKLVAGRRLHQFENAGARFKLLAEGRDFLVLIEPQLTPRMKVARHLPASLVRFAHFKYMDSSEAEFASAMYHAVLWLAFTNLLRNGGGLLHASAVELEGRLVALSGKGGAGKTTLSGWLISKMGGLYMADDLLPLAQCRIGVASDLYVHIYPYNVMIDQVWRNLGRSRFGFERVQWALRRLLFGPKGTCRRLPKETVYLDKHVARDRQLDTIIWLTRNNAVQTENLKESFVSDHFEVLQSEMRHAFAVFEGTTIGAELFPLGFSAAVRNMLIEVVKSAEVQVVYVDPADGVDDSGMKVVSAAFHRP